MSDTDLSPAVERVARAIARAWKISFVGNAPVAWEDLAPQTRGWFASIARDAIEAQRKPWNRR